MNHPMIIIIAALGLCLASCTESGGPQADTFDRTAMLTQLADNLIIPSYDSAATASVRLATNSESILTDGDVSSADVYELRREFTDLALQWQRIVTYNFGPAEGDFGTLAEDAATFPCDTAEVWRRIAAGDTLLRDFRRDTRGLATIDYLLFRRDAAEIARDLSDASAGNMRTYLRRVINRLRDELTSAASAWKQTYRSIFINRSGTDAGSSVSLLLNELNKSFELLKNYKLGLPLGLRAGQTTTEPTKIESYYSGLSYLLLGLHYSSIREIWSGRLRNGTQIPSFRAYLLTVVNGPRLIEETEAQFARIDAAYGLVGQSTMSELIRSNPQALVALHTEMQKLTRFIKSEMSSLLGISITYSSGDGD